MNLPTPKPNTTTGVRKNPCKVWLIILNLNPSLNAVASARGSGLSIFTSKVDPEAVTRCKPKGNTLIQVTKSFDKKANLVAHEKDKKCSSSEICIDHGHGRAKCEPLEDYKHDETNVCKDGNIVRVTRYTHNHDGEIHYKPPVTLVLPCPPTTPCIREYGQGVRCAPAPFEIIHAERCNSELTKIMKVDLYVDKGAATNIRWAALPLPVSVMECLSSQICVEQGSFGAVCASA